MWNASEADEKEKLDKSVISRVVFIVSEQLRTINCLKFTHCVPRDILKEWTRCATTVIMFNLFGCISNPETAIRKS